MSLYFIQAGIIVLIISRLVNGFAVGIASTAISTVVAQILPNSRKGEGIGYFQYEFNTWNSYRTVLRFVVEPTHYLFCYFHVVYGFCHFSASQCLIYKNIENPSSYDLKRKRLSYFSIY